MIDNEKVGVLYLRLSNEDGDKVSKADLSQSIDNQRLLLMDYCLNNDIKVVDVYIDDDFSGLYDDRPGFDLLIRDSKLGKFNIVIAKTQARLTRNMQHVEKYLHHDFPLLGIRFIGVVDGTDTAVQGNKKMRQIYGLTNEWYCEDLSANIRSVYKKKMEAGQFLGAFAPYGYLKDPKNKYDFIVDEPAAKIVRMIFGLYIEGYSPRKITHILEDKGISNPTVYKQQQGLAYQNVKSRDFGIKYNLWSTTTIKRIITNQTYIGDLVQGMAEKISYKDKKVVSVPEEDWIVVKGHHEPIIDTDIFEKVKKLRKKRRVLHSNQLGNKKIHMLAGKVLCSTCGSTMIKAGGVYGDSSDSYLRCQLSNKSRQKECTSHSIKLSMVEKSILENIQNLIYPFLDEEANKKEILDQILKLDDRQNEMKEIKHLIKTITDKIANKKKAYQLIYEDKANGNITNDMFSDIKATIEEELSSLVKQKEHLCDDVKALGLEQDSIKEVDELFHKYCDFSTLKHEMVFDFIDYVEVTEKKRETKEQEILIHWNF